VAAVETCGAFVRISRNVWRWMKRARRVVNPSLSKSSLPWGMSPRETTLTDYVVLRLLEECYPQVRAYTFPSWLEAKTGADLELWITDNRQWLGLRVQSKVLNLRDEFEELHYKPSQRSYQCDVLIQAAQQVKGCMPVYLLYVGPPMTRLSLRRHLCTFCPGYSRGYPRAVGNWWASAYRIQRLRPKKDLRDVLPYMVPWHCIVCCPHYVNANVAALLQNLRETVFLHDGHARQVEAADALPRYVELAIQGRLAESVDELRQLIEGREMRHLVLMQIG